MQKSDIVIDKMDKHVKSKNPFEARIVI